MSEFSPKPSGVLLMGLLTKSIPLSRAADLCTLPIRAEQEPVSGRLLHFTFCCLLFPTFNLMAFARSRKVSQGLARSRKVSQGLARSRKVSQERSKDPSKLTAT